MGNLEESLKKARDIFYNDAESLIQLKLVKIFI